MSNERIVLCEACGSEGHLYEWTSALDTWGQPLQDISKCPWCEGTGGEIIETQPIELEDLDEMSGSLPLSPRDNQND
jgi:hypothetical protein